MAKERQGDLVDALGAVVVQRSLVQATHQPAQNEADGYEYRAEKKCPYGFAGVEKRRHRIEPSEAVVGDQK